MNLCVGVAGSSFVEASHGKALILSFKAKPSDRLCSIALVGSRML